MSYFQDIESGIRTTLKGLSLTMKHLRNATKRRAPEGISSETYFDQQNGLVTLQYPHEQLPIPDNGRYRLRNEIDDCIVCDKCAKVCPVDCITIDAIKATEEVGRASDGSPIRLYAGKFDIDMAKCCYCGLCTAVCPTECLTMDKKFDYSEFELGKLTYNFTNLTPEEADEKRALYEQFLREKEEAKRSATVTKVPAKDGSNDSTIPAAKPASTPRPVFRPTAKPPSTPPTEKPSANSEGSSIEHPLTDATPSEMERIAQGGLESAKRPVFRPTQKPKPAVTDVPVEISTNEQTLSEQPPVKPEAEPAKPKPAPFRPTMKPGAPSVSKAISEPNPPKPEIDSGTNTPSAPNPKPAPFRPTMKPAKSVDERVEEPKTEGAVETEQSKTKPASFRPTMKPASASLKPKEEIQGESKPVEADITSPEATQSKPKPTFRPTMKPAQPAASTTEAKSNVPATDLTPQAEAPKAKPPFRPTMKPTKPVSNLVVPNANIKEDPQNITSTSDMSIVDPPKPKPAFRPTMKPKPKSDNET